MPPWHHGTMTRCGTLYSHPHCQISAIIDTFFYLRFEELDRSRLSFLSLAREAIASLVAADRSIDAIAIRSAFAFPTNAPLPVLPTWNTSVIHTLELRAV
jgi:hypothetical protein